MKPLPLYFVCALALLVGVAGCSKSPDATSQPADLEAVLQGLATSAPAIAQYSDQAVAAVHSNDFVRAASLLHAAKMHPQLSWEQRMAVRDALQAISRQLTERALRGDEKARADLVAIEKIANR